MDEIQILNHENIQLKVENGQSKAIDFKEPEVSKNMV